MSSTVSIQAHILETTCFAQDTLPSGVIALSEHAAQVERGIADCSSSRPWTCPAWRPDGRADAATHCRRHAYPRELHGRDRPRADPPGRGRLGQRHAHEGRGDLSRTSSRRRTSTASASGSPPPLHPAFREVAGTSWLAHVRKLRIDHAKKLLEHEPDRPQRGLRVRLRGPRPSTAPSSGRPARANQWRTKLDEDEPALNPPPPPLRPGSSCFTPHLLLTPSSAPPPRRPSWSRRKAGHGRGEGERPRVPAWVRSTLEENAAEDAACHPRHGARGPREDDLQGERLLVRPLRRPGLRQEGSRRLQGKAKAVEKDKALKTLLTQNTVKELRTASAATWRPRTWSRPSRTR